MHMVFCITTKLIPDFFLKFKNYKNYHKTPTTKDNPSDVKLTSYLHEIPLNRNYHIFVIGQSQGFKKQPIQA